MEIRPLTRRRETGKVKAVKKADNKDKQVYKTIHRKLSYMKAKQKSGVISDNL